MSVEFACDACALQAVTGQALRTVSRRGTVRVLGGLHMQTTKTRLTVTSSDMEVSGRVTMKLTDAKPGAIVVPAKSLDNALKTFDGDVTFRVDETPGGSVVRLEQGRTTVTLETFLAEDFPRMPVADEHAPRPVSVMGPEFKRAAVFARHAASSDESRPVLTGVLLEVGENRLHIVATDSFRMAYTWAEAAVVMGALTHPDAPVTGDWAIVRATAVDEVCRLLKSDLDFVEITAATGTQVIFKVGNVEIISRRIDGQFPNWRQLIPDGYEEQTLVDRADFVKALDRITKLGGSLSPLRIGLFRKDEHKHTIEDTLWLTHRVQDSHELTDEIPASQLKGEPKTGREPVEFGINAQLALEAARAFSDDNISLCTINPLRPIMFLGQRDSEGVLIMPIRLAN